MSSILKISPNNACVTSFKMTFERTTRTTPKHKLRNTLKHINLHLADFHREKGTFIKRLCLGTFYFPTKQQAKATNYLRQPIHF